MPIITNVDPERGEVHAVAVGTVTFDDVRNHLLLERHFGGLAYKEFVDARGAWISLSAAENREIAEMLRNLRRESRLGPTAVLVSDDVAFGVIRMLEALVEDVCEVKPFRDEQEARAWLATSTPTAGRTRRTRRQSNPSDGH
jgi:hypothetical protein